MRCSGLKVGYDLAVESKQQPVRHNSLKARFDNPKMKCNILQVGYSSLKTKYNSLHVDTIAYTRGISLMAKYNTLRTDMIVYR